MTNQPSWKTTYAGRLWSVPRIALDLAFWATAAALSRRADHPAVTALAVFFIGAVPMHDLLVHGHEGTHRHLARRPWLNELLTWFTHALVGLSGTAYRAFHLDHHRYAQTERDPEYRFLDRLCPGAPGWAYLRIPFAAHAYVNAYPFRGQPARVRARAERDLAGTALLHALLLAGLGARAYLLFVLAPIFTGLAAAVVLRSVCEHHGAPTRDRWTRTRTNRAGALMDFLWSNTSHHLEHHLYPAVPFHRLPAVRRALAAEMAHRRGPLDRGLLRTGLRLLREPRHFDAQER
jgi:fatty acid desaturase